MINLFGTNSVITIPFIYVGALVLTILIELSVLRVYRIKDKLLDRLVIWVNVLTNPILNVILILFGSFLMFRPGTFGFVIFLLVLEILVVIAEYKIINKIFSRFYSSKKILQIVIMMNFASFVIGEVIKLIII